MTTAAVPGRAAPVLVTREMIEGMRSGSVIVDLAADRGGNTEVTRADADVPCGGAVVLGPTDLASRAPNHASQLFSTNVANLLDHLIDAGDVSIDLDDEITAAMLVSHQGTVVHPDVLALLDERRAAETS